MLPLDALRRQGGNEPVGRHTFCLALQFERLDRLDFNRVANEAVRRVAEQNLVRRRRLLEARGRVDRIARHQPLPRRRIAGNHLAGVDARAVADGYAPALVQLLVQSGQLVSHLGCSANRPQRVVFVEPR